MKLQQTCWYVCTCCHLASHLACFLLYLLLFTNLHHGHLSSFSSILFVTSPFIPTFLPSYLPSSPFFFFLSSSLPSFVFFYLPSFLPSLLACFLLPFLPSFLPSFLPCFLLYFLLSLAIYLNFLVIIFDFDQLLMTNLNGSSQFLLIYFFSFYKCYFYFSYFHLLFLF